jgi:hypothetical protein
MHDAKTAATTQLQRNYNVATTQSPQAKTPKIQQTIQ